MGLEDNNSGRGMTFFTLKSKIDDNTDPLFVQSEKVNGHWTETNKGNTMKGMLSGAKIETKKIKDMDYNFFVLFLEDNNGLMKIQMSHNRIAYSIINSIASNCNKISDYSFSVYKKASTDGKYVNGKASCKIGDERLEWAIDPTTVPERQPVMVGKVPKQQQIGGKLVWDYSDQQNFWEELFRNKIISILGTGGTHGSGAQATQPTAETTTASPQQEDDLPF